ncbi:MAG: TIGR00303 family protein [Scytonematopsis contorta HA4267-MV1]|jgi:uncharacterized protein (TIGR00303 family)|nr:TIGR00303 family protein [Scytonematopsis contorta HA4267-MV1]
MIEIYTQIQQGEKWAAKYRGSSPIFACVLGFTETALIPGISAAGRTPEDRKFTAYADAEFLYYGAKAKPHYPLPPLAAGASPVLISRAVIESLNIPLYLFNAGLPQVSTIPMIDLGGVPAKCLSQGTALELAMVQNLLEQGLIWGERLAKEAKNSYLILGECVVGGTTTALAILTGLGIPANGLVNSSHPVCNHNQKWKIVQSGLKQFPIPNSQFPVPNPLELLAAVGDPMQVVVAGMAISASRSCGILLAGGTQMLAVYALINIIAETCALSWCPEEIVVGTTRWVAEDLTAGTVELAKLITTHNRIRSGFSPPLIATRLSFANSRYPQLQAYEQGFVKEGVGAGGACIAAYLSHNWQQPKLLSAIEFQLEQLMNSRYE